MDGKKICSFFIVLSLSVGANFAFPDYALSDPLPKATEKIIKALKLDPAILKGLDKELDMPPEWIEGSKKERKVRIFATWDPAQFRKLSAPFKERFPFVELEYSRASFHDRAIKTLIAFKGGRYSTDILTGFGGSLFMYKKANAFQDLRNLPNFKNAPVGMRDPDGLWVGARLRYWCMAYNAELVKKEDVPKKWENLLTNPRWRGGKIGIANRPQLWALSLWGTKGEEWTKNYLTKLFSKVKPQLRKEGTNAMIALTIVGEFDAAIPSAGYRTLQYVKQGAPLGWACPEPVPLAISEMGVLRGNPHPNASNLFANWFLSKEGQLGQYYANRSPPVHKDLRLKKFLPFPDQIEGKKVAFRDPALEDVHKKLLKFWVPLWQNREVK